MLVLPPPSWKRKNRKPSSDKLVLAQRKKEANRRGGILARFSVAQHVYRTNAVNCPQEGWFRLLMFIAMATGGKWMV